MVSLFLLSIPPLYTQMHVRVHKPYLHGSMGHSTCAGVLRCSSPLGVRINCLQTRKQQSTIYQSKFVPPTLLHTEYTRLVSTVDIFTQYYLAKSCPYLWTFIVQTVASQILRCTFAFVSTSITLTLSLTSGLGASVPSVHALFLPAALSLPLWSLSGN